MTSDINKQQVIEWLSAQSVIEIAALVKDLEKEWGVSAAAPVAAVAAPSQVGGESASATEEKSEFQVVLTEFTGGKVSFIKSLQKLLEPHLEKSMSVLELKKLVDAVADESKPTSLLPNVLDKGKANKLKEEIEALGGAKIELK